MQTKPAYQNRRKFISSISLLTAGAVCAPAINFVYGKSRYKPFLNCSEKWDNFCKLHNTEALNTSAYHDEIKPHGGHIYTHGNAVLFKDGQLIAQPVWIYWPGVNKRRPSDVIVHFYQKESKIKIATLNQFELEALYHFYKTNGAESLPVILSGQKENAKRHFIAKTDIRENNSVKIYSNLTKTAHPSQTIIYS